MKTRLTISRFLALLFILLCCNNNVNAQSETRDFITYDTLINAPYASITWRLRISRPTNYFTLNHKDTASRVMIYTTPGQGEMGTDYNKLRAYGPHSEMTKGWDGGIVIGNGTHYPIIITAISSNTWMSGREQHDLLTILKNKFHPRAIHAAGLSQGAFSLSASILYETSAGNESGMKLLKSLACFHGASEDPGTGNKPTSGWGRWAKKYDGRFFGLEGNSGDNFRNVWRVSNPINDSMPGNAYFSYTSVCGGGHCGWDVIYSRSQTNWSSVNPLGIYNTGSQGINGINRLGTYKNGSNIYQWMLRQGDTSLVGFDEPTVPPVNKAPIANAGADLSITLPIDNVVLNGSGTDVDGSIVSYAWFKISGPASFNIALPSSPQSVLNNLVEGTYQFALKVSDDGGSTGTDTVTVIVNKEVTVPPVNKAPIANAGADLSITLPIDNVVLNGSGTDVDGSIVSYAWFKISGPASFNIALPSSPQSVLNNLVEGIYQFALKVSDDGGSTGSDTVTVIVNKEVTVPPVNKAPIANAGADLSITLPIDNVVLKGSGTDVDGSIVSYAWFKISGPASFNIALPSSPQSVLNNLVEGIYQFALKVSDDGGSTGSDTVTVIVNKAVVVPPTSNDPNTIKRIGLTEYRSAFITEDGSIYSFVNQKMSKYDLAGRKAIDATSGGYSQLQILDDAGYVWTTQLAGLPPKRIELDTTNAAFNNNIAVFGHYFTNVSIRSDSSLWYWGHDNYNLFPGTDIITKPIKLSPSNMKVKKVAMGGLNLIVLLANGEVWQWKKNGSLVPTKKNPPTSRPAIDIFAGQYDVCGCIIPSENGSQTMGYPYVWGNNSAFWGGATTYAEPTSVASLWGVTAPIKEIAAGTNTIHYIDSLGRLFGLGDNPNGEVGNNFELVNKYTYPTPYAWSWTAGEAMLASPAVQIGQGIVWGKLYKNNTIAYFTFATDVNNSVYFWGRDKAVVSGRGYINWQEANYPNALDVIIPTKVNPLQAIYQAYDFALGTISAGTTQTVISTTVTLAGVAVAPKLTYRGVLANGISNLNHSISAYQWSKISGSGGVITSPNEPTTTVTQLTTGTYKFRLITTDDRTGTMADTVTVVVNNGQVPVNDAPVANAGLDINITLPTSSTTLNGVGTDVDGTISSYTWTKIAGPTTFSILTASSPKTGINLLVEGTYQFELKVVDNLGAIDKDTVLVKVNPAPVVVNNIAPKANAGLDINLTLPSNSATLNGSGTDADGTISSYIWTKIAGPTTFSIVSPGSPQTGITGLLEGAYQFELKVTDNKGAIGRDTVLVKVNPAPVVVNNIAPKANAGLDINVTLPSNNATLNGSGTDADGTISSYIWTKIAGPTTFSIVSPGSPQTGIAGLLEGTYQFELKVTDNKGAIAHDTVLLKVNAPLIPNQAPVANAGADITITLPTSSVTLNGSGTDADGTISFYEWKKVSGPTNFAIDAIANPKPVITNLTSGEYVLELTVTDNKGAVGRDIVKVTVLAAPTPTPDLSIFPNPVRDILNLEIGEASQRYQISIIIYSTRGTEVYRESFFRDLLSITKKIDVSKFKNGTYFIKVLFGINTSKTLKFIKM